MEFKNNKFIFSFKAYDDNFELTVQEIDPASTAAFTPINWRIFNYSGEAKYCVDFEIGALSARIFGNSLKEIEQEFAYLECFLSELPHKYEQNLWSSIIHCQFNQETN